MTESTLIKALRSYFPFGFHLSREFWDQLDVAALTEKQSAVHSTSETYAVRTLAERFNRRIHTGTGTVGPIEPGQLITVGVIVDILRYLTSVYCQIEQPGVIPKSLVETGRNRGKAIVEQPPPSFVDLFPPQSVAQGQQNRDEYLRGEFGHIANRETVIDEMLLLLLSIENPAFKPCRALFDDSKLKKRAPYLPLMHSLETFFARQPAFGPLGLTLFEALRAPMQASPDSLEGQLEYIRKHWASFLPEELLERLLLASDILKEERQLRGLGPGPNQVLEFLHRDYADELGYPEPARFSHDADWMSNVVLIAKSVYVWLDQLSKKYQRHIRYLSDVPDEELDRLARWGFTGLWLIGLWERSSASQQIKQAMGNPEAVASAYSLDDYTIALDLGGEQAYENLRERAWQRRIRLASDMVPNHMGICSRWVIEHPDWFIQCDNPPFPCYRYTGMDLSSDPRTVIQIEDGYWNHSDAAVVFKRIDKWTGQTRYIYHGNDGTSMPWNDTAQLNFLIPEVREAVIQTILHVARKFPIIRFDAAMTLAKRHYQRLWFPKPGEGGAIPSRAEHSMTKAEFDTAFPTEFWREVVDRVSTEVPDTLLLAEAFWLMEGYFVRTLGMHRVYNSAFMNMLKMEDNQKYRTTVKNVLEFSPEVLKRFVNFMNNPDEDTAVAQFGKDDKYYGVAVLMVTMPGLPMFGHGQVEGFTEKYGMEYRRAYWDEQVDEDMVRRHEREIFPLMRRRHLFSGATNFAFYDFNTAAGWTDENVFAYSNRTGDERAVILYNNAYNMTEGWIHTSTPINVGHDEQQYLVRKSLGEALQLNSSEGCYYIFREYRSGHEFIRTGRQLTEEGLYAKLWGYQYQAFLDFREIHDTDGSWGRLAAHLNGNGVPDMNEAYREMLAEPVLVPFRECLSIEGLDEVIDGKKKKLEDFETKLAVFLRAVSRHAGCGENIDALLKIARAELASFPLKRTLEKAGLDKQTVARIVKPVTGDNGASFNLIALAWIAVHHLGRIHTMSETTDERALGRQRLHDWFLRKALVSIFEQRGEDPGQAYMDALLVVVLCTHEDLFDPSAGLPLDETIQILTGEPAAAEYLQINRFDDVLWCNREQLERLMAAFTMISAVKLLAAGKVKASLLTGTSEISHKILTAADHAGYQIEKTMKQLSE